MLQMRIRNFCAPVKPQASKRATQMGTVSEIDHQLITWSSGNRVGDFSDFQRVLRDLVAACFVVINGIVNGGEIAKMAARQRVIKFGGPLKFLSAGAR